MKKKYKKTFLNCIIIFIIFSLSIGYSAFSSELSISKIVADVRIKKDVRITDVSFVNTSSKEVLLNDSNYDADSILANITFSNMSSYVTFKVTISNLGNQEIGIYNINLPDGLRAEISNYKLNDKICDNSGKCSLGISKNVNIKVYPVSELGLKQENMKIDFDFRIFHKITYTGINIDNTYPTEIIDGGNLSITFKEDLDRVIMTSNNIQIGYYNQITNGQTITINNIIGDVEIFVPVQPVVVEGDLDSQESEICIGKECFYLLSSTEETVTLFAKYNLYVGNSLNEDFEPTPLSNPTGRQDSTALGCVKDDDGNEIYPLIGTTIFSNTGPIYSGSIVEGYVNDYALYLERLGIDVLSARLITEDELYLDEEIVYSSSYWIGEYSKGYVDGVLASTLDTYQFFYDEEYGGGVRPVIEISRSLFSE